MFSYTLALEDFYDCATDGSFKAAILYFDFFPSPAKLAEFFEAHRKTDPDWQPPAGEFEPPHGLAAVFEAWRRSIGTAAYRAWLMGAEAWRAPDGRIAIKAASALKASWIRRNYATALESLSQQPVEITYAGDPRPVQHWPNKGPRTAGDAWYQTNERWKNDIADVGDVPIGNMFRWDYD